MDAAKLDHIQLLGAQLMWLRDQAVLAGPSDIVSLKPSDLEPPTTARGAPLSTPTVDTGFVTQGTASGWGTQGALTASSWSGLPVMSPRIKPTLAASSEPVLPPRGSQLDYERVIVSLQQTVVDQNVRIAALEQKIGDTDELLAR